MIVRFYYNILSKTVCHIISSHWSKYVLCISCLYRSVEGQCGAIVDSAALPAINKEDLPK